MFMSKNKISVLCLSLLTTLAFSVKFYNGRVYLATFPLRVLKGVHFLCNTLGNFPLSLYSLVFSHWITVCVKGFTDSPHLSNGYTRERKKQNFDEQLTHGPPSQTRFFKRLLT